MQVMNRPKVTCVTDPAGNKNGMTWDVNGNLTSSTAGAGVRARPCLSRCSETAGGSGCVVVDGAREQMDR